MGVISIHDNISKCMHIRISLIPVDYCWVSFRGHLNVEMELGSTRSLFLHDSQLR